MSSKGVRSCVVCLKSDCKLFKCKACGVVLYCGVECQRVDWKQKHKEECVMMSPIRVDNMRRRNIGIREFESGFLKTKANSIFDCF